MSVGETYLTVQGRVGGDVKFKEVPGRVALASFRLGTTPRQFDKSTGVWVDRPTTWFTVECWRTLAKNVQESVRRGEPVIVTGRLKTTEWVDDGEKKERTVIDAFSVGHDLTRGTTSFSKNPSRATPAEYGSSLDVEMRDLSAQAESDPEEASPFTPQEAETPTQEAA